MVSSTDSTQGKDLLPGPFSRDLVMSRPVLLVLCGDVTLEGVGGVWVCEERG